METKFNFNSQVCTSRSQSERLLALGLKKETADMVWIPEVDFDAEGEPYDTGEYFERPIKGVWDYTLLEGYPAWSLHRLIEMRLAHDSFVVFQLSNTEDAFEKVISHIEHAIKEGYFNKEYLV